MHLLYLFECGSSEIYRILQRSSKRDDLSTFSEFGQSLNTKSVGDSQFKQKQNIQLLVLGYVFLYRSHFSSRVKICRLLSFLNHLTSNSHSFSNNSSIQLRSTHRLLPCRPIWSVVSKIC